MIDLIFRKCALGFVFHEDNRHSGTIPETFAFNTVEEAARWLVERHNPLCPPPSKLENS